VHTGFVQRGLPRSSPKNAAAPLYEHTDGAVIWFKFKPRIVHAAPVEEIGDDELTAAGAGEGASVTHPSKRDSDATPSEPSKRAATSTARPEPVHPCGTRTQRRRRDVTTENESPNKRR